MKPIEKSSCCTPQETVENAAKAMKQSGCGCTPVVEDKEKLGLVGVVTERDICHSVAAENRLPSDVSVEEIMRSASSCCSEDESLEEVKQKLDEHQATSLPVVDKAGSCCGTISLQDIG
ncbi:MAG: CBS domain-containing protein [Acidobacteria bacterium]|nr:CBS domain-containing protein [Acidobacteriota bacterium]